MRKHSGRDRLALLYVASLALSPAACAVAPPGEGAATQPATQPTTQLADGPTARPWAFLGVPDEEERLMRDLNPQVDGRIAGITTITKVSTVPYADYLDAKKRDKVGQEERHGGFVYFSSHDLLCAGPAMVPVTQRYKAPLPDAR